MMQHKAHHTKRTQYGPTARVLFRDTAGAAYHLGVTLVFPIYLFLIVFTVELCLVLNAKMVVTHATYAAARAAAVWLPADDLPLKHRRGMVYAAAVNALAPIASSRHALPNPHHFHYDQHAPLAWPLAYRRFGDGQQKPEYLARKWEYAARATRIRVEKLDDETDPAVRLTLEYEHPFHTSAAARFLGSVSPWLGVPYRTATVRSTVVLQLEQARATNHSLNIPLHVDHQLTATFFKERVSEAGSEIPTPLGHRGRSSQGL